ncbi:hypothetical protein [Actinomadura sp. CNU-125]|uniref:hypothetical protein n=1 Tax=Actinomadura sp. CNU-125 TaxID=1904961 RepID=UPI001177DB16|nr:hypothetical protein [Actinomadura sp. CNU-125]
MTDQLLKDALDGIADRAEPVDGLADRALRTAARRRRTRTAPVRRPSPSPSPSPSGSSRGTTGRSPTSSARPGRGTGCRRTRPRNGRSPVPACATGRPKRTSGC